MSKKIKILPLNRGFNLRAHEDELLEGVFTTGEGVQRGGVFDEPFIEELSIDKDHIRTGRLEKGIPLLDSHDRVSLNSVLGRTASFNIEESQISGTIRLSKREDASGRVQDIRDGIAKDLSLGYRVFKFQEVGESNGMKVMRAVDWEPFELSVVPVPAEQGASLRSDEASEVYECEVQRNMEEEVKPEEVKEESAPEKAAEEKPDAGNDNTGEQDMEKPVSDAERGINTEEVRRQAISEERTRQAGIREAARKLGLPNEYADELCALEGLSLEDARSRCIDKKADLDRKVETDNKVSPIEVSRDEGDTYREGVKEALLHRHRGMDVITYHKGAEVKLPAYNVSEKSRHFVNKSLLELAKQSLEMSGVNTRFMSRTEIAGRALHSGSDFSAITSELCNKSLRDLYALCPRTWQPFTRQVTAPDFKTINRVNMGDGEALEKIKCEYPHATASESSESYSLCTYGKIFAVKREVIINDDLGAMMRVPEQLGRRAADKESDEIWQRLIDGKTELMGDGVALFDAAHGNLAAAAGVPSEAGLNEARQSMRLQTGLDGECLSLTPTWFYVAPGDETTAEKLVASIVPDSSTNVSPFSSSGRTPLRLGVEPRLQDSSGGLSPWFVMSDLSQIDMVEIARLAGENGPVIETEEGFDVDGLRMKVRLDFGTKVIDHRGLFRNDGV